MDREEYEARARRIEHCASSDVAALASDVLTLAAALEKARAERDAARAERNDVSARYEALLRDERDAQRTIAELRQKGGR